MTRITLITGGARSGKSAHAITLARQYPAHRAFFIATAEPLDDEMRARIAHHRASRQGAFATVEEPLELSEALRQLDGRADVVIVDCLTLWISNLLRAGASDQGIRAAAGLLADCLRRTSFPSLIVSGEVGSGIVPEHPLARRFRDLLGWTNQAIGAVADTVVLMVAGLPLRVK